MASNRLMDRSIFETLGTGPNPFDFNPTDDTEEEPEPRPSTPEFLDHLYQKAKWKQIAELKLKYGDPYKRTKVAQFAHLIFGGKIWLLFPTS